MTLDGYELVDISGTTDSGAVFMGGSDSLAFENNGVIKFLNNEAYQGGAIVNMGRVTFSSNTSISFTDNLSSGLSYSSGGAIDNEFGALLFTGSGDISFSNNSSERGGAIFNRYSTTITSFTGNGTITFSGNKANQYEGGEAIWNSGELRFERNADVIFDGNTASSSSSYSGGGGAIESACWEADEMGSFYMIGNERVLFTNNNTVCGGGAIYFSTCSPNEINGNGKVSIVNNDAGERGGGINSYRSCLSFSGFSG